MSVEEKKSTPPASSPKEERDKHNALLAGVIFFMLLIIILWAMNLNLVFKSASPKPNDLANINQLSRDFKKAFNQVGAKITELKNIDSAELQKYAAQFSASSSLATTTIKK
ncbi:MAG: hypothetical protein PHE24_02395 [Patescibacteria group bacterium]|nr:hypothetical protein [Patescibacteria group bacterium]